MNTRGNKVTAYLTIDKKIRQSLTTTLQLPLEEYSSEERADLFVHTPLSLILASVYYLPYGVRKFLLDFCRVQVPVLTNEYLNQQYAALRLVSPVINVPQDLNRAYERSGQQSSHHSIIRLDFLIGLLSNIYDNPLQCSLLSYFVRAERTAFPDEFLLIGQETIQKEMKATQQPDRGQCLDYTSLFTDNPSAIHSEVGLVPTRTIYLWKKHISSMRRLYNHETHLVFPHYNGRKTVSLPTQNEYTNILLDHLPSIPPTNITSKDLLFLYYRTGMQVGGDLEMRKAWFITDLKPRGYYCLGGSSFWAAIYIKDFTKRIQQSLPSTHPDSRYNITRIRYISENEIIVTYDYSAFTTSLAELKYFVSHLATAFEGVKLTVLDVYAGIVELDLGQYLKRYNEVVNMNQVVSLARILKTSGDAETFNIYQNRSGSLGVGGNIGLSTTVHGVSLAGLNDTPDEDSVVGDDALHALLKDMFQLLLITTNKLGDIHPDKFSTFSKTHIDDFSGPQRQGFKYTKRPITVDFDGRLSLGTLDMFPNFVKLLFPEDDGIHTFIPTTPYSALQTFVTQWGRFLHLSRMNAWTASNVADSDVSVILACIQSVYVLFDIPVQGLIPSLSHTIECSDYYGSEKYRRTVNFWVPPCDSVEVFERPWLDILLDTYGGSDVVVPVFVPERELPLDLYTGATGSCTSSKLVTLMADLKCLELEMELVPRTFDATLAEEVSFMLGYSDKKEYGSILYNYTVLEIPIWYESVMFFLYPTSDDGPAFGEAVSELQSVYTFPEDVLEAEAPNTSDYGEMEF